MQETTTDIDWTLTSVIHILLKKIIVFKVLLYE